VKLSTHNKCKLPIESCKARISASEVHILHVYEFIFLAVGNAGIHPCCKIVSTKGH